MMNKLYEFAQELNQPGQAFINGNYRNASGDKMFVRESPVDGKTQIHMAACSEDDIDAAVAAARLAVADGRWSDLPPEERKRILLDFAGLIECHARELALLDTLSMGKAFSKCRRNDIPRAVQCLQWYAEAIDKIYGECVPPVPDALGIISREPLGVVGAITPWNYPPENLAWKIGPALAAGNCLVLKPAEQASAGAVYLGTLAQEAGIPDGVLNIVPGLGEIAGRALALHNDVDGIFFTGSSDTGKRITQYAGLSNLKRVALECGGKSAFIVLRDCGNPAAAAEALAEGIFSNQGQTCSAPSRLIIEDCIHDKFLELLLAAANDFQPGNPFDEDTEVGAIVSHAQLQKALQYVEAGKKAGAKLVCGGTPAEVIEGGAYMTPTIFTDVSNDMLIAREEIFGPVLSVIRVKDADEALAVANQSSYGLAAGVWTENINLAHSAARKLRAGTVHINSYGEDNITAPFGGYKQSGNGSKDKSLHALDDYSELKTTWLKISR
ncbi:MAG: aldehyde dehydrogenase family protein [Victivallales bacterium]|nr:aldehyde dehydrogenase family protein [Victivallales bacterium]